MMIKQYTRWPWGRCYLGLMVFSLLMGCAGLYQAKMTLHYQAQQIALTPQQKQQLSTYFEQHNQYRLLLTIGPSTDESAFDSLWRSQQRLKQIHQLAMPYRIQFDQIFDPNLSINTVIIETL